jgi:V8-like Glu-specific endopeptidase
MEGAAWLRLYFGDVTLGEGSSLRITSMLDGEVQSLDAQTLAMWSNSTAYFNGSLLKIELFSGPETTNHFTIDYVASEMLGKDVNPIAGPGAGDGCGICGGDDRVQDDDDRFFRIMPVGCSGTIYNESSCGVTAGHCLQSGMVAQFRVPDSASNCATYNPPVSEQFPVTDYDGTDGGVGNDYGALAIGTNNSGQRPFERYGVYVEIANSVPSSGTLHNNGYGVDDQCARSQTQQYHSGPLSYRSNDHIEYNIDATFGNSGSSILYNNAIIAVVTHCSYSCTNYGTRIDKNAFENVRADICEEVDPPATGACCIGGSCYTTTEASCSGSYLGDNVSCSGNPCAVAEGACCLGTSCYQSTESDCGGEWLGEGVDCEDNSCTDFEFQGLGYSVVGHDLVDTGGQMTWTVDVYAKLNEGERLDAVAGTEGVTKTISTSGTFYQHAYGGPTSISVNPALFDAFPDLRYDSRVTIGALDSSGDPYGSNVLSDIGIDWDNFENGGAVVSDNGTWYVTPEDEQGEARAFVDSDCGEYYGVLIARLTTYGASSAIQVEAFLQGKDASGETWMGEDMQVMTYVPTEDCNANGVSDTCDIANGTSQDADGNGIPDECEQCDGDYTGDGMVGVADLLFVIDQWGSGYGVTELLVVLDQWGCGTGG